MKICLRDLVWSRRQSWQTSRDRKSKRRRTTHEWPRSLSIFRPLSRLKKDITSSTRSTRWDSITEKSRSNPWDRSKEKSMGVKCRSLFPKKRVVSINIRPFFKKSKFQSSKRRSGSSFNSKYNREESFTDEKVTSPSIIPNLSRGLEKEKSRHTTLDITNRTLDRRRDKRNHRTSRGTTTVKGPRGRSGINSIKDRSRKVRGTPTEERNR